MTNNQSFHVLYLTGAPATGKTMLGAYLERTVFPIVIFHYSQLLDDYMTAKGGESVGIEQLRSKSAQIITREDIAAVDKLLIEKIEQERTRAHVIIDSHAVTKEKYGYRITPFSIPLLNQLNPTMICVLYADPNVVLDRITANREGRPPITTFEAAFHSDLQSMVAITYSMHLDIPIYFFDTNLNIQIVADEIVRQLRKRNINTNYNSET